MMALPKKHLTLLPHEEDEAKVRRDDKTGEAREEESDVWEPERLGIEAKHGQDGRGGDFDIDAVCERNSGVSSESQKAASKGRQRKLTSVIFELEIPDLVDQQRLEGGMEKRKGLEPAKPARQLVSIDQQPRKEEAAK